MATLTTMMSGMISICGNPSWRWAAYSGSKSIASPETGSPRKLSQSWDRT